MPDNVEITGRTQGLQDTLKIAVKIRHLTLRLAIKTEVWPNDLENCL